MPPSIPHDVPPVVWATIVVGGSGDVATEGGKSTTVEWLCRCNRPDAYPSEIATSSFIPPRGDPLRRYRPNADGILSNGELPTYSAYAVVDANMAVAGYSFRQTPDDPWEWRVSIKYEESTDPTVAPAEFSSDDLEYQDHENIDINGLPVANSAGDLIIGGMPTDRAHKLLRLTRCLPFESWDSTKADSFRNTLNRENFYLSRQTQLIEDVVTPVFYPPGSVRIKKVSEQELIRSQHPVATDRKHYWKVSVELHIDMRVVRQPDGSTFPTRHQFIFADAGYREFDADGNLVPIFHNGQPATEPQLLDYHGKSLLTKPIRPVAPGGWVGAWPASSLDPIVLWSEWETMISKPLVVASPGVLKTAYNSLVTAAVLDNPAHGTLSLAADGSFTYTPTGSYTGWDHFTFTPTFNAEVVGTAVTVFVFVRPTYGPWWLTRDRYKTVSWAPLDDLLVGW